MPRTRRIFALGFKPSTESHIWWRIPPTSQEASMSEKEPAPVPDDDKPTEPKPPAEGGTPVESHAP
jgi:hypothetical protein